MFLLVAYDVNSKRCNHYMKLLKKYLVHKQKSIFVGDVTKTLYKELTTKINKIKRDEDDVIIYEVLSKRCVNEVHLTNKNSNKNFIIW